MGIRPLDNRIIVRPTAAETVRASGLVVVCLEAEKPLSGEVVAVGPGRSKEDGTRDAMRVSVGDQVMFGKYAQQPFEYGGETLLAMCEMDVLFIMDS